MVKRPNIDLPDEQIAEFCRRWKIVEFSPFGSAPREDFGPRSDLDVLISFAPDHGWSLFDLVQMQDELEAIVGRKVDLAERQSVEASENYVRRRHILGPPRSLTHRDDAYLLDILLEARQTRELVTGVTREAFLADEIFLRPWPGG